MPRRPFQPPRDGSTCHFLKKFKNASTKTHVSYSYRVEAILSSRMALGRSAGDMRTRRAGARACRQQLEEPQQQQRKRPLEDSSRTLQTKLVKSKTRERWTSVSRQKSNRPPCTQITRVCEAQSMVNPSSSQLLCNCRRHRARLGSMASRSYLLFGRSIARPLFAPLGFESMLV